MAHPRTSCNRARSTRRWRDTFPASDPPSQTSPFVATPSSAFIASERIRRAAHLRVIEPRMPPILRASRQRALDAGRSPCVYASLSPATAMLEYLVHLEGRTPQELLLAVGAIPGGVGAVGNQRTLDLA